MKAKLLGLIDEARRKESDTLTAHVDDSEPQAPGQWTAKDLLAHLMSWRQVAAQELQAARTGGPLAEISSDDDVQNGKFYESTHPLRAASIIETASRSWDELAAGIDQCSEEELQKPRPRYPEQQLWQVVPGNTYNHLPEHLAGWLEERGQDGEAERVAVWGHGLATAAFPEDRSLGVAAYNLGCFYAKRGRAAEALTYLSRGLALRPDLREWAKSDSDLDPIRSQPAVASLLG